MKVQEFFSYLCVKDAGKAIEFYEKAFGAKEKFRLTEPNGRIGHAKLDFGCAILMLSDEFPEYGHRWTIGHHVEDVTPKEMQRRYDDMMKAPNA